MVRRFRIETSTGGYIEVEINGKGDELNVTVYDDEGVKRTYNVRILELDDNAKHAVIEVNGRRVRVTGLSGGIIVNGIPSVVKRIFEMIPTGLSEEVSVKKQVQVREKGLITAPIAGKIIDVKVKPGDKVEPDSVIALLASMKMITEIKAGVSGVVETVYVKPNDAVQKGDKLVKIKVFEEVQEKKKKRKKKK